MKILVTGAAGFIGMHVAERLLARGDEVVGLDNFNAYYDPALKEARWARLTPSPRFTGVRADMAEESAVHTLFQEHAFDAVVHLAAQAGVRYSLENPMAYVKSNLVGFVNLLEACRAAKTPRLLYASSSSVYGGNQKVPFAEEDRTDDPVSLYAATKKSDELLAHVYSNLFGLQTIGFRFFTVYGPWGRPDMAPWLFTEAILAGKPIKLFNNGDMSRDFTYIDDIVAGILACLDADGLGREEIFNIGKGAPESLGRFVELLSAALGREPERILLPMQPGDVPRTYADVSKLQKAIGYAPKTSIDEGIPRFTAWFEAYHQRT